MTYKILKTTLKRSDFIGEYEDMDTAKQVKRFEEERGEGIITIVPNDIYQGMIRQNDKNYRNDE